MWQNNFNAHLLAAGKRTFTPLTSRQLAELRYEREWLGPGSAAFIQSRLANQLYAPVWGQEQGNWSDLTDDEQSAVLDYYFTHVVQGDGNDELRTSQHVAAEDRGLHPDVHVQMMQFSMPTNPQHWSNEQWAYQHGYMNSLQDMIPSNPSTMLVSTCLNRNCAWSVYIAQVGAILFHRPGPGHAGCLEYVHMSYDEKELIESFATEQVKIACRASHHARRLYHASMTAFLPAKLPFYKLAAQNTEWCDFKNKLTTYRDLCTNLGAILFDRPWAGERGAVAYRHESAENDFVCGYMHAQEHYFLQHQGVAAGTAQRDEAHLESGHSRHMRRLHSFLSDNLPADIFDLMQDYKDRYVNGAITFADYIKAARGTTCAHARSDVHPTFNTSAGISSRAKAWILHNFTRHQGYIDLCRI
jgi:hypothetical protein